MADSAAVAGAAGAPFYDGGAATLPRGLDDCQRLDAVAREHTAELAHLLDLCVRHGKNHFNIVVPTGWFSTSKTLVTVTY